MLVGPAISDDDGGNCGGGNNGGMAGGDGGIVGGNGGMLHHGPDLARPCSNARAAIEVADRRGGDDDSHDEYHAAGSNQDAHDHGRAFIFGALEFVAFAVEIPAFAMKIVIHVGGALLCTAVVPVPAHGESTMDAVELG
eukprot:4706618-Prymnesium_polylepis.1